MLRAQKAGEAMSKRHDHRSTVFPPKVELRAHAHNERHRVNAELHSVANMVSHGVEPEDVDEPGIAWKGMHTTMQRLVVNNHVANSSSTGKQNNGSDAKLFANNVRWR